MLQKSDVLGRSDGLFSFPFAGEKTKAQEVQYIAHIETKLVNRIRILTQV